MKKISKNLVAGILGLILMFGTTGYIYAEYNSGDYDYNPSICEMYGHNYSITGEKWVIKEYEITETWTSDDGLTSIEITTYYPYYVLVNEYTCMNCGDSYTE